MNQSTMAVIRVLVLLALAVGEAMGLLHYSAQPMFPEFISLSAWLIFLVVPLLWIGRFWQHGVSYLHVAIVSVFGYWALNGWLGAERMYSLLAAAAFLVGVINVIRKMIRPVDRHAQAAHFQAMKQADVALFLVAGNTAGLLACFVCWAKMWSVADLKAWSFLLVVPALWFGWRVVFRLFFARRAGDEVTAIE